MRMFFAPGPTGFDRSAGLLVWPAASDAEAIATPEMKSLRFMGPRFSFESRTGKDSTGSNWQLAIGNWQNLHSLAAIDTLHPTKRSVLSFRRYPWVSGPTHSLV